MAFNVERILALMARAEQQGVAVLVFPELSLTGYTFADLFQQVALQRGADRGAVATDRGGRRRLLRPGGRRPAVDRRRPAFQLCRRTAPGQPPGHRAQVVHPELQGVLRGPLVRVRRHRSSERVELGGATIPFGTHYLFEATDVEELVMGVEVCEDLWVPIPPSSWQAIGGATLLVNLSASNEVIGKSQYRRQLVINQSGRCMAAYAYASCGVWESTTDVVFGGHCLIAENGTLLKESERFRREEVLLCADVDLERAARRTLRTNSFGDAELYRDHGQPTLSSASLSV